MAWHPEIQTVSVGGYNYALLDRGAGDEAVVLIHGITTYSFIWRKILPLLPTSKRVIALDLLGCGGSDMSAVLMMPIHVNSMKRPKIRLLT